jgi:hypothetical protein
MKEFEISSWDEFSSTIEKINAEYGSFNIAHLKEKNRILYRGQADSEWSLESTLERFSSSPWSVESYARLVLRCAPQVESFTERNWNLLDYPEVLKEIKEKSEPLYVHIPCYEFLVYLRHHGFPSPLLDWTSSPYIAAFFAFAEQNSADKAAIFAYIELPQGGKSGWEGSTQIRVLGPYTRTHRRHFLQQSWYTVCTVDQDDSHRLVCHEDIFKQDDTHQDLLIKIIIPRVERIKVLSYLNEVNINYFSLFQSEEALMKTLAFKEIEYRNR